MTVKTRTRTVATEDILMKLCDSVESVLLAATNKKISHSVMVQKIHKTSLRPDLGCFVLFDGGFSGLVVINFTAAAAIEIYQDYMVNMGMPQSELATLHTSDEVENVTGELMNQIVGGFTSKIEQELQTVISQNQPKMLSVNKNVVLSVDTNLDRPQARRVTFRTEQNNIFYLELAMDKTEFIQVGEIDNKGSSDPDEIIANENERRSSSTNSEKANGNGDNDDLLDELGI
ncbi:MAG: DUF3334 family protein [Cellvibrionaceae bacterium]